MNSKKLSALFILFLFGALIPLSVYAAEGGLIQCGFSGQDMCQWDDVLPTINRLITFVLTNIAIPVSVIVIIIGGIRIMISGAQPSEYAAGKKMITGVVWALAITFGAWVIVKTILAMLGIG